MSAAILNPSESILDVKNISKKYKINNSSVQTVLNEVNLKIREGEFITIIGKSGCGKSTLLSILAGLDRSFTGELLIDDKAVSCSNADRIVIFQEHSLFPWLNVIQNIEFGLRQAKVPKCQRSFEKLWL